MNFFRNTILLGHVTLSSMFFAQHVSASANTTMQPLHSNSERAVGIRMAQSGELPNIAPSSLRRMIFYSDKAIIALFDLANEDIAIESGNATISSDTTDALRTALERLIDAGDKAKLDVDHVALFFSQEVAVRFSGTLPIVVQDVSGNLDATNLFRGIVSNKAQAQAPAADTGYLSALLAEGADMAEGSRDTETVDDEAVEEIIENTDPILTAIVDRSVVSRGKRTIVVASGDTLAVYAAAFYGDSLRYRAIFLANSSILQSPNFLEVGQVIIIPKQ